MTVKLFAVVLLALTIAACEPASTDNNSNANNAKPNAPVAATPAPVSSPEAAPSATPALKAGDKVKVIIKGSSSDATVVDVDEKLGKVTVRIQGQKEEKTVAIGDVTKQ